MLGAVIAVAVTAFAITAWLLSIANHASPGTDQANARLDAVRTGLAAGAGAGAAVGLMLAFRRQHHQEISTALTDHDATERRITELYTKAVEQLGNDKAPVRLGGLYALERLAQDNPAHRQTIVNVICAYLRMPFPLEAPSRETASETIKNIAELNAEGDAASGMTNDTWQQERQVRLTAQRILSEHLRPADTDQGLTVSSQMQFWEAMRLDLTGATLIDFRLTQGIVSYANFSDATFNGIAEFGHATFNGYAFFDRVTFAGGARFSGATFNGDETVFTGSTFEGAWFEETTFRYAAFNGTTFNVYADFLGATINGEAAFGEATFNGTARFEGATFNGFTGFGHAFNGEARFERATFNGETRFNGTMFSDEARFDEATFNNVAQFGWMSFPRYLDFDIELNAATFGSKARFDKAIFNHDAKFDKVTFNGEVRFDEATFNNVAQFGGATFVPDLDAVSFTAAHVRSPSDQSVWPRGWLLHDDGNGKFTVVRNGSQTDY